jgi:hypothetical protein
MMPLKPEEISRRMEVTVNAWLQQEGSGSTVVQIELQEKQPRFLLHGRPSFMGLASIWQKGSAGQPNV